MKKSPLIRKIVVFGILSVIISLMLSCLGFGIVEFYNIKNESITKANSQMDILAYSLQPTLLFDDKEAAEKILLALRSDKSINKVRLYRANGREFASFIHVNRDGNIILRKNIYDGQKLIGSLEIEAVYLQLKGKYIAYLWVSLVIIMISVPASYIISEPIRRQVSLAVFQLEQQSNRLRLLADQVVTTEQMERKRIASIIHDHLQQILVASKLQLTLVLREIGKGNLDKVAINLKRVDDFIDEATQAARTLTVELRPPVLYEDGLVPAFQWLAKKFKNDHDFEVSLRLGDIPAGLSDTLKIMIFESVREILFNVVKYSGVQTAELYLKYAQGFITVSVKDQGHGFDVYSIEKKSPDKGFGLFSIRERLKLLNGELKITSNPGKGTEVEIILPVAIIDRIQEIPQTGNKQSKQMKNKGIRILLVDDHRIVREGLANLLKENAAFEIVAHAENGQEAVEKAEIFLPDVVIMDINMPKLNGIEATRIIKSKFPYIKVIGLSVQNEEDVIESMKKAGVVALLNKAGDPQELIETVLNCGFQGPVESPL
jgi:signal transduction histidine kinase/CheY-like chemotaxis protein